VPDYNSIANKYSQACQAARLSPVQGEAEAQLTKPIHDLFTEIAKAANLGELIMVRETRLDRTRPDFAVLQSIRGTFIQKGFVELKAPSTSIDPQTWAGRNLRQWEKMSLEAEILIVCNGHSAQLFKDGSPIGNAADLPLISGAEWNPNEFIRLLKCFLELSPSPVKSISSLSHRLAYRTADLRDRLLWLLSQDTEEGIAARGGFSAWKVHIKADASERDFADGISQVISYGMVLAALVESGERQAEQTHFTVTDARNVIRRFNPVMAASFAPLVDKQVLFEAVRVEVGALEALISAIDIKSINLSGDHRGEPWLYFYEDFLAEYDPEERRQAGVYYTPLQAVYAMVSICSSILVDLIGLRLGFSSPGVVILDPAAGTGTFPLAVVDYATKQVAHIRGIGGIESAVCNLANNLLAFELLPGPYSVAHLRLSQRYKELVGSRSLHTQVVLTDTLENPFDESRLAGLFGDAEVLAIEQERAKDLKLNKQVTVIIGNPPYRRVRRDISGRGSGGWVLTGPMPGQTGRNTLFEDILETARENTIFSHQASLYNLYVYFWRWAIWKAFETRSEGPAIVAFITASSWLDGPGFVGLRKLSRQLADHIWVIDLGGDNRGANPEENIFSIETPVAIVVMARLGSSQLSQPADVCYRRIRGSAESKLTELANISNLEQPLSGPWTRATTGWLDSFIPSAGGNEWDALPELKDLFPWQQPGCMHSRMWPIAPHPELLERRWNLFASSAIEERPALYVTPASGRNIYTKVAGYTKLSVVRSTTPHEPIVRYGFRSFDRQWTFQDPRLAKTESPSLWSSQSHKQIFLATLMTGVLSEGPAATISCYVPDKHFFNGRGGRDIIPLYRDALGTTANITEGLTRALSSGLNIPEILPEDLFCYAYCILSSPYYKEYFADGLQRPGARLPITKSPSLWNEAVEIGKTLLWLHSFATRFIDESSSRSQHVPIVSDIQLIEPVSSLPRSISEIRHDLSTGLLHIGDGTVCGVSAEVWNYSVSGWRVLEKWLSYRTRSGAGRAASSSNPLDLIRPLHWYDEWNDELLDIIRTLTITVGY
jgi:hypothetical protein